ncbi:hypothetical protein [Neobacillus mesonae]|uniref:hypothetical protein n=1 Tax=Neobacillus mesonae TaxID=1193713 RepID=UPI002E1F68CE|nr:hypothetical protein [Neobacillus mesonae]
MKSIPVHIYECEGSVVTFAVEQALAKQSEICCPVCQLDESIRDVVSGDLTLKEVK